MVARVKEIRCEHKEALQEYKEILNIKQTEKATNESVAITLIDLGHVYLMMKMFDLADENLSTALDTLLGIKGTTDKRNSAIDAVEWYLYELNKERKKSVCDIDWFVFWR